MWRYCRRRQPDVNAMDAMDDLPPSRRRVDVGRDRRCRGRLP